MKGKKLLAACLLVMGLCFVPGASWTEIPEYMHKVTSATRLDIALLEARIDYIMRNPTVFVQIDFIYDPFGGYGQYDPKLPLPKGTNTKGKICIDVRDRRGSFSYKSGTALLEAFKGNLEIIYSFIDRVATNMSTDVVAKFYSQGDIPLGYFYQGEYHLWDR